MPHSVVYPSKRPGIPFQASSQIALANLAQLGMTLKGFQPSSVVLHFIRGAASTTFKRRGVFKC